MPDAAGRKRKPVAANRKDHNMIQGNRKVDAPPLAASQQTAPQQKPEGKGVAPRNRWFKQQYEASGTETYRSHAAIRDKWNRMTKEQRAEICPANTNIVTREGVITGIKRA